MTTTSIKNLAYAIYESSKDKKESEIDSLVQNIISFLSKKRMLSKSDKILSTLEKVIDDDQGITRVTISSRLKISDKIIKEIEEFIKKKYKSKTVEITLKEDEKLLGGIKIEIGDEVLDTTLQNKIKKLQTYLIEN